MNPITAIVQRNLLNYIRSKGRVLGSLFMSMFMLVMFSFLMKSTMSGLDASMNYLISGISLLGPTRWPQKNWLNRVWRSPFADLSSHRWWDWLLPFWLAPFSLCCVSVNLTGRTSPPSGLPQVCGAAVLRQGSKFRTDIITFRTWKQGNAPVSSAGLFVSSAGCIGQGSLDFNIFSSLGDKTISLYLIKGAKRGSSAEYKSSLQSQIKKDRKRFAGIEKKIAAAENKIGQAHFVTLHKYFVIIPWIIDSPFFLWFHATLISFCPTVLQHMQKFISRHLKFCLPLSWIFP